MLKEGYKSAVKLYNQLSSSQNGRNIISFFAQHVASKWDLEWFARCSAKEGIKNYELLADYKDWKKFVKYYYQNNGGRVPDLCKLSYNETITLINKCKRYYATPNTIFNKDGIYIGRLNSFSDAYMLPIDTTWCITKISKRFDEFCTNGNIGLYIINNNNVYPYKNVIAILNKGNVEYWDTTNNRMSKLPDEIERFNQYESTLTNNAKNLIYSIAANNTDDIEERRNPQVMENVHINSRNKMKTRRILLTEAELHKLIRKNIKELLQES